MFRTWRRNGRRSNVPEPYGNQKENKYFFALAAALAALKRPNPYETPIGKRGVPALDAALAALERPKYLWEQ